jgi:subtilisin-like proprotein convertase family protein
LAKTRQAKLRRLAMEGLEPRTLMAVLPTPTVTGQFPVVSDGTTTSNQSSPSIAIDPVNPLKMATVWTRNDPSLAPNPTVIVEGASSSDGGHTWTEFSMPFPQTNPTSSNTNPQPFAQVTDGNVAFDRSENFYVVAAEHDAGNAAGIITLQKFNFAGSTPSKTISDKILYSWTQSAAVKPMLAVDNNLPSFIDTGADGIARTQSDPTSGNIYVAWATIEPNWPNIPAPFFNANAIRVISSSNGGTSFSAPQLVNQSGNGGLQRDTSPQLVISQGRPAGTNGASDAGVPGGQVSVIWDDFNSGSTASPPVDLIDYNRFNQLHDTATQAFASTTGGIGTAGTTTFNIPVNVTDPNFVSISDVAVQLDAFDTNLGNLTFTLVPPNGAQSVTLIQNGRLSGTALGFGTGGTLLDLTLDVNAWVPLSKANAPYIGDYGPDDTTNLSALKGTNPTGIWKLQITDSGTTNVGSLVKANLILTSGLQIDTSKQLTIASTTVRGSLLGPFPLTTQAEPLGIGPGAVIASDNTLGQFSDHEGRLYVAYVDRYDTVRFGSAAANNPADNTDIFLVSSDDGGKTWATGPTQVNSDSSQQDGYSASIVSKTYITGRPQFQPSLAVDNATGTLVVSYFDTQYDAARARVAMELATSIDGGSTFGPETFANTPLTAFDAIAQKNVTLGPIPDNQSPGNPNTEPLFAFGSHQGLAVYGGHIYPAWASNNNGGSDGKQKLEIEVAPTLIATGPRVISGTMGQIQPQTVTDLTTGLPIPFNSRTTPGGSPILDGFVVTFDRPIDPASFTAANVAVFYRDPNTSGTAPGTLVALAAPPVPIVNTDPSAGSVANQKKFGASKFFVRLTDQTGTGTYSYAIGPNIHDRIRAPISSNIYYPQPTQIGLAIPGGGTATSSLNVSTPADTLVDVNVTVSIAHQIDSHLNITLLGPGGQSVVLSNGTGLTGSNFTYTTFDDQATATLASGNAPFTGSFKPVSSLSVLNGINPNGIWTLKVTDSKTGDPVGTLKSWFVTLETRNSNLTSALSAAQPGAPMDQNSDGQGGEDPTKGLFILSSPGDLFEAPNPAPPSPAIFFGPFSPPPFDSTTLPLMISGPHVASTRVPGAPVTPDNLVTDRSVSALDVTFDRDMQVSTFTPADVTRIVGPVGTITGAIAVRPAYNATDVNKPIPDGNSVTSTLTIPNDGGQFVIQDLKVRLDITHPQDSDLTVVLIAPDNTQVTLFSNVGGASGKNFTDTLLDDQATATIGSGASPFTGSFKPLQSLDALLAGKPLQGIWQLKITDNNTNSKVGVLNSWSLEATPLNPTTSVTARTFRVTFPAQQLDGTYSITLAPNIQAANGDLMDSNLDAGLDQLRNTQSAGVVPITYNSNDPTPPVIGGATAGLITTSTIDVPDSFTVQAGATVLVNIAYKPDPDLEAVLIAPNGTQVPLFQNVGASGSQTNFFDTIFDDGATTPIQNGGSPFFGRFNPKQPLAGLANLNSKGTWTLQIKDDAAGTTGQLLNWSLTLVKPLSLTGLGSPVADITTTSFRIFSMDPLNPLSSNVWAAVGPAGIDPKSASLNGEMAGRVSAIAVDPSDPSGNTVYIGAASGGVWKTTDFLTTDPKGPTYVPLTDFGPGYSLNIGSIAVFGRNNDPNQSIIIAGTGEGAALGDPTQSPLTAHGIGFLRSMDGGATWTLLDSTDNTAPFTAPAGAPQRDHSFARFGGTTTFKVAVDPTPLPNGNVIIYAALTALGTNTDGGIWRSLDTGATWQLMRAGNATDVTLDLASGTGVLDITTGVPKGNIQIIYGAFEGDGVYISPNRGQNWNLMAGGIGDPLIQEQGPTPQPVPVTNGATPNGVKGRIVLVKPALTNNRLQNELYQGWLYAAVATAGNTVYNPGSHLDGLYLTKDFGQNWTKVAIPVIGPGVPSNDTTAPNYTVLGNKTPANTDFGKGNYDISVAVDPTNPNVVYVGGTDEFQSSGLIRVDTTGIADPHAFYEGNNANDGGQRQAYTTQGPLNLLTPAQGILPVPFYQAMSDPFLNMISDPRNPFVVGSTILTLNSARFTNTGGDAKWIPFDQALQPDPFSTTMGDPWAVPTTGVNRIVTMTDPLTGRARLIFGDDNGVYTAVDAGNGTLVGSVGDTAALATSAGDVTVPSGSRNGNLQIAQMYAGASQPSYIAGQIATLQGMFYGSTRDNGTPQSDPNIVNPGQTGYGNLSYVPPSAALDRGTSGGVATEQNFVIDPITGLPAVRGNVYGYQVPESLNVQGAPTTDFFQVNDVSRTFGLLQNSGGGDVTDPQWPYRSGLNFAVNPLNGDQALISSTAGRIFRTENQGAFWSVIGDPNALDNTYAPALAFGAPDPNGPGGIGNLDNLLYAGTSGGHIYMTQTGGGGAGNQWSNISGGLDGSPVEQIITNPNRGSHEAYAVLAGGFSASKPNDPPPNPPGNLPIPANGTVTSTVTFKTDIFVNNLTVTVNISDADDTSLTIMLIAPDGTQVPLVGNIPTANPTPANFTNTTFDDQATTPIQKGVAPFTGSFQPTSFNAATSTYTISYLTDRYHMLSDFYGKNIKGVWQLAVTSHSATTGTLNSWSINYTTLGGIYHNADTTSQGWVGVDSNLFRLQQTPFGDPSQADASARTLTSITADWRYAIPDSFSSPNTGSTHPMLYAAGNGGVYRSVDDGTSWQLFPSANATDLNTTPTPPGNGGGLPNALVTDLDLALGNIDPNNGQPRSRISVDGNPAHDIVSPNLLMATTYGRGQYAIRLSPTVFDASLGLDATLPAPGGSDSGNSSSANNPAGRNPDDQHDTVTNVIQPVIDGFSLPSAFGNVVVVNLIDETDPKNPVLIGTGQTDANGHFAIQVIPGYFKANGSTDGAKVIGVQAVDQAGTPGNVALFHFTLDTTPPVAPGTPVLSPASDTGISNSDDNTSNNKPVFNISGVEQLAKLVLFRDGVAVNTIYDVGVGTSFNLDGTFSIQDPGVVPDGTHVYTVQQFDVAGNAGPVSSGLTVVIDTTAPAAPTKVVLESSADTGISNTDANTSVNANLPFDISGIENPNKNGTVQLLRNGVVVASMNFATTGTVTLIDQGPLPDGTYTYTAIQIDLAGNISSPSAPLTVVIDTTPPVAPARPVLEAQDDTGSSNTDGVTLKNANLHFDIAGIEIPNKNATVELLRKRSTDPVSAYVVVASMNFATTGTVTLIDPGPLSDGTYNYVAEQIDLAGNVSPLSSTTTIVIDTTTPAPPAAPVLLPADDSGTFNNDNVTKVTNPRFTVSSVLPTSTVQLLRKLSTNPVSAYVVVATRVGAGVIQDPGPVSPDAVYTYAAKQVNQAGTISGLSAELPVTVDTTPPAPPAAPVLDPGSDSGVLGDNITNVINPFFDVAGVEANANLELFRNGVLVNTLINVTGGTVVIQDPGPVQPDGKYTYTAEQIDLAGNASVVGSSVTITIATSPPAAPGVPILEAQDDTGASNSDGITSKNTNLHFDVNPADATATVQLLRKLAAAPANTFIVVGSRVGPGAIVDPGVVSDGQYDYAAREVDIAGNIGPRSGNEVVTIDTITPAAPNAPVLDPASDTGISNHDDITRITLSAFPVFDLSGVEATATVFLLRNGTVIGSRVGPGQIADPNSAPDGVYTYTAYQVDLAGNGSPPNRVLSSPLLVTYDTTAPVPPSAPVLDSSSDSGVKGDNITNITNPLFDLTSIEPNAIVQLLRDGKIVATDTFAVVGSGGAFSIQDPGPVSDGAHSYNVFQTDVAGNTSPIGGNLTITIKTSTPSTPGTPVLDPASDSGVKGDNVTNVTNPTFDVPGIVQNGTVQLLRNGVAVATVTSATGGTVAIQDPGPVRPDGIYIYTAQQTDVAGNASLTSSSVTVTIQTTAPTPSTPVLDPASDSGVKGDNITNVTSPFIDVTSAQSGATVQLFRNGVLVGSRVGPGAIHDPGPVQPDGAYTYTAKQIDIAGNTSLLSGALNVTIATALPAAPSAPNLDPASDSGVKGDNITNVTSPTFDIATAATGDTLQLLRNGAVVSSVIVAGARPVKIQDTGLLNGQYTYTVQQVDVAGNVSPVNAALVLTVDTNAPLAPTALTLDPTSDSGKKGDNLTSVTTPIIDISTIEAGATVQLFRNGVPAASLVSAAGGTVNVQDLTGLSSGQYTYTATQTDVAGNVSPISTSLTITIDTTTPAAPQPPVLEQGSNSGSKTDNITNVNEPTFDVSGGTKGDTVQLLRKPAGAPITAFVVVSTVVASGAPSDPITDGNGATPAAPVPDGKYDYAVNQVAPAGGTSLDSSVLTVTIDTTAPVAQVPVLVGGIGSPSIATTTARHPQLTGTTEPGATVTLFDGSGHNLGTVVASATGTFTVQPTAVLTDGQYSFHFQITDVAGNQSAAGPALGVTVTTNIGDYDNSGKASIGIFRPTTAQWFLLQGSGIGRMQQFGTSGDIPMQGDFDGDGKTDLAIYRPSTSTWYILRSTAGPEVIQFGAPNLDIPVVGDFDGDGKTDIGVFRPTTAEWFILGSSSGPRYQQFGGAGDTPITADFDGDGKTDIGVFRASTATWYILRSTQGPEAVQFGAPNLDVPVPGDYDGDHKADLAVFRPTTGDWFVLQSTAGAMHQQFGQAGDIPVPADYDGDGKFDLAVFRPSQALWAINQSTAGSRVLQFGAPNLDIPVNAPYRVRALGLSAGSRGVVVNDDVSTLNFGRQAAVLAGPVTTAATSSPAGGSVRGKRLGATRQHSHVVNDMPRPVLPHGEAHGSSFSFGASHDSALVSALTGLGRIKGKRFLG